MRQLAHGTLVEKRQGQGQQAIDHRAAQGEIHPVGGVDKDVGAQGHQQSLEDRQHHHQRAQHIEAAEVALAEHLVDDLLDQQRNRQAEQLAQQRRRKHKNQSPAILAKQRGEPAPAKATGGRTPHATWQHKPCLFIKHPLQVCQREPHQAPAGVANQHLLGFHCKDDHRRSLQHQQSRGLKAA